jgi:hypothetical protein
MVQGIIQVKNPSLSDRKKNEAYNLVFSYTVKDDHELSGQGLKFLGAGQDELGVEVHVFEKVEQKKFQRSKDA